jgi:hypothetical protein
MFFSRRRLRCCGRGYDWDLPVGQMDVSLTQIFDRLSLGREFFEEIIRTT